MPQFLLKRFASDTGGRRVWSLDKETGRSAELSIRDQAVIKDDNTLRQLADSSPSPEEVLAMIEGRAAEATERLFARLPAGEYDRSNIALFAWMQDVRTPTGRDRLRFGMELFAKYWALQQVSDLDNVRRHFERTGRSMSDGELQEFRRTTIQQIESGELLIGASHDHEVTGMFLAASEGAFKVANFMSWTLLRAPNEAEFILGDHPVAFFDPERPGKTAAWLSSDTVEVTLPLAPRTCLRFTPGPPELLDVAVGQQIVADINLRTYASANWSIYGTSAHVVQQTRLLAKRMRGKVAQMVPRRGGVIVSERYEHEQLPFKVTVHDGPNRGQPQATEVGSRFGIREWPLLPIDLKAANSVGSRLDDFRFRAGCHRY